MNNEEQLIRDLKSQVKEAMDVASLFKGQSYLQYTKGIQDTIRSKVVDIISNHFTLSPEELLLILEDSNVVSFLQRIQVKTIKDNYEYKNTLH